MRLFLIACIGIFMFQASAQEKEIAAWDFTRGLKSTNGSFELKLRGRTLLQNGGLDVGISTQDIREGAVSVKNYPELCPAGAFSVEAEFTLRKSVEPRSTDYLVICDNKYIYHPKQDGQGIDGHAGFVFALNPYKGRLIPVVVLGQGDHSSHCQTAPLTLAVGRRYKISFRYDGREAVSFYLNGKQFAVRKVKAGSVAQSQYPFVVGDRVYSNYKHFEGVLHSLKIFR